MNFYKYLKFNKYYYYKNSKILFIKLSTPYYIYIKFNLLHIFFIYFLNTYYYQFHSIFSFSKVKCSLPGCNYLGLGGN